MKDAIDKVLDEWRRACPQLKAKPMSVVGRILRLAGLLERRGNESLASFDLPLWAFDVLGTLRRSGPPFALTPTELSQSTMLTTGAMTNRIDRLEKLGLVRRERDPKDRRSLQVHLTDAGLGLVVPAAEARFAEAKDAVQSMSLSEQQQLAELLKNLLLHLDHQEGNRIPPNGK